MASRLASMSSASALALTLLATCDSAAPGSPVVFCFATPYHCPIVRRDGTMSTDDVLDRERRWRYHTDHSPHEGSDNKEGK